MWSITILWLSSKFNFCDSRPHSLSASVWDDLQILIITLQWYYIAVFKQGNEEQKEDEEVEDMLQHAANVGQAINKKPQNQNIKYSI